MESEPGVSGEEILCAGGLLSAEDIVRLASEQRNWNIAVSVCTAGSVSQACTLQRGRAVRSFARRPVNYFKPDYSYSPKPVSRVAPSSGSDEDSRRIWLCNGDRPSTVDEPGVK